MATLLTPDGERKKITPANGKKFTLDELQKLVGGYVELLVQDNKGVMLGRSFAFPEQPDKEGVPKNPEATKIYCRRKGILTATTWGDIILASMGEVD